MFTYNFYIHLLDYLKASQYSSAPFGEGEGEGIVWLRHDVDIDFEGALRIGNVEIENEVKSIFFFQPNNDLYNMLGRPCSKAIETLNRMGHEIGLHIDASSFQSLSDLMEGVHKIYEFYCTKLPICRKFSFHRPAKFVLDIDFKIDSFIGAYEKRLFKDVAYVSDSNRKRFWEETKIWEAINSRQTIHLLTHPIWWNSDECSTTEIQERIRRMCSEQLGDFALKNNIKLFS